MYKFNLTIDFFIFYFSRELHILARGNTTSAIIALLSYFFRLLRQYLRRTLRPAMNICISQQACTT